MIIIAIIIVGHMEEHLTLITPAKIAPNVRMVIKKMQLYLIVWVPMIKIALQIDNVGW